MAKKPVLQNNSAARDTLALRFLYHTIPGRAVLRLLVRPRLSRLAGRFLDSRLSRLFIRPFIRRNHISLEGVQVPAGGFSSFNAFFTRKRQPVRFDPAPDLLLSPCDGYVSCFPITPEGTFPIKHTDYSLGDLLQDPKLASFFSGGLALLFRLTPADYHRYCYVDDGAVLLRRRIPGVLHCVRPIAAERYPIYIQNTREYTLQSSAHFGRILQMEIGALLVGRICNHNSRTHIARGEEKGYFAFGGSSILLLLPKDSVQLAPGYQPLSDSREELPVKQGQIVGMACRTEKEPTS